MDQGHNSDVIELGGDKYVVLRQRKYNPPEVRPLAEVHDEIAAILDGIPAGLELSTADINADLARRQKTLGAGGRMRIEKDQVTILSGQTNSPSTMACNQIDNLLVHQTAQHHLDDIHGLTIGYPHTIDKLAFLADFFQQPADLRPATMHHYRVDTHQFHQHDIARKTAFQVFVHHGITAILDNHGLALEATYIGQRLGKHLRNIFCRISTQGHVIFAL